MINIVVFLLLHVSVNVGNNIIVDIADTRLFLFGFCCFRPSKPIGSDDSAPFVILLRIFLDFFSPMDPVISVVRKKQDPNLSCPCTSIHHRNKKAAAIFQKLPQLSFPVTDHNSLASEAQAKILPLL